MTVKFYTIPHKVNSIRQLSIETHVHVQYYVPSFNREGILYCSQVFLMADCEYIISLTSWCLFLSRRGHLRVLFCYSKSQILVSTSCWVSGCFTRPPPGRTTTTSCVIVFLQPLIKHFSETTTGITKTTACYCLNCALS